MEALGVELTLGPLLFNWRPEVWRDFYFRVADEAPIGTVYLGEVICSKRTPFLEPHFEAVVQRLTSAGKSVVFSTLSEVMHARDRRGVADVCDLEDSLVEANDCSALLHLTGRPHHIGPFVNVYNEDTLAFLVHRGARNVCLPFELPGTAIGVLGGIAPELDVTLEVQAFGRVPLALSARCYHARAHGRIKDNCQFVCDQDPDGLELDTLDGKPFLTINGIQTLSHDYLNLVRDLPELRRMGISRFRLSPHSCDMVQVAKVFRHALDSAVSTNEAGAMLEEMNLPAPFSNGFFHGRAGHLYCEPNQVPATAPGS